MLPESCAPNFDAVKYEDRWTVTTTNIRYYPRVKIRNSPEMKPTGTAILVRFSLLPLGPVLILCFRSQHH
jgi:hypothetical protein